MPHLLQTSSPLVRRTETLEVRLATTFAEIDAAMRLRFAVFNLEMQEGLSASYERGYDQDAYDAYCDHLIVQDRVSGEIVGTYRLLRGSVATRHIGFYSDNEFDLSVFKTLPGEALELGRSCVARSHRSFATINLLWEAICQYAEQRGLRYLFGCASLHCAGASEVQPLYDYLRKHHSAPVSLQVTPHETCRLPINSSTSPLTDERQIWRRLPPLLKGYLRAGALVCGAPAFDAEFGTADVLILMQLDQMQTRYQHHYAAEVRR